MFRPKIPRISIRLRLRLPKFKFPRIAVPFGKIASILGAINTLLLVSLGSLGLLVSYINPVPYIAEWITWLYGYDVANEAFIQVNYLQENLLYTMPASVGLIILGLLLHVTSFQILVAYTQGIAKGYNPFSRQCLQANGNLEKLDTC